LLLARELLHESGSCFVQISDENIHHIRELMDEIFGVGNFVEQVSFRKKNMTLGGALLEGVCDYLIWYTRDKEKIKFRRLFIGTNAEGDSHWNMYELPDESRYKMNNAQVCNHKLLPESARIFQLASLYPAGSFDTGIYDFNYSGASYRPPLGRSWKTPVEGMNRLAISNRLVPYEKGATLRYAMKLSDYSTSPIHNIWVDTAPPADKKYVVQTGNKVLERCILMTTDPRRPGA
jgi:adenine-specific DNA-methyltransferase